MRKTDLKKTRADEGLADLAHKAERDHEVQMARSELYKLAKYSIKLHDMLKGISEEEGLEGWVQSKITKAADYISSVYHHLDYDQKFDQPMQMPEATDYKSSLNNRLAKIREEAESVAQQRAAAIALKHKREGTKPPAGSASESMMSMSEDELEKIASTKHAGLPGHVGDN